MSDTSEILMKEMLARMARMEGAMGIGIEPVDKGKRVIDETWNCNRIIKKFNKKRLKTNGH